LTAQIHDGLTYKGADFAVVGKNGANLFDPTNHELKPVGRCSACWRGFVCGYAVENNRLYLDKVAISLGKEEQLRVDYHRDPPTLFGKSPKSTKEEEIRIFSAVFEDLSSPVAFSGGLLIAKDFIEELYVHMGFHPDWKYRNVHELVFNEGELIKSHDRSAAIAEFRDEMKDAPLKPDTDSTRQEIRQWIERCFSLDYRW
jgi:hypothetical protein